MQDGHLVHVRVIAVPVQPRRRCAAAGAAAVARRPVRACCAAGRSGHTPRRSGQPLRQDLQQVVNHSRGTAYTAFSDFGEKKDEVGGKTGTAEIIKRQEDDDGNVIQESVTTALFVGVAPIDSPEYVVVVIIERGGSGGAIAAPTAKPVLQYLLNQPITDVFAGEDAD